MRRTCCLAASFLASCTHLQDHRDGFLACADLAPAVPQSIEIEFHNASAWPIELSWVSNDSGDLKRYATIAPGDERAQRTWVGHYWAARRSNGRLVGTYCADGVEVTHRFEG